MNFEKVSYGQLASLAQELNNASQNMANILGEVTQTLNKIENTEAWQGDSAQAAKVKFDQLSAKFPEFSEATGKCYTHIMSVIENYKSVDQSVMN